MANYIVYLGARHWKHGAWQGDFYPPDLPEDWQLPFYNTQFRCVFLPAEIWQQAGEEEIAAWLQETRADFRFVLEGVSGMSEADARKADRFGERGVMADRIDIIRMTGDPDLRELAGRMQKAAQNGVALYVISDDGALPQLRKIGELMSVLGV